MKQKPLLLLLSALLLLCGCGAHHAAPAVSQTPAPPGGAAGGYPRQITDAAGSKISISHPVKSIVSGEPAITEILYAIGAGQQLKMNSSADSYPVQCTKLPHFNAMSADVTPILAANPDLVICDAQNNKTILPGLQKAGILLMQVNTGSLADIYRSILMIGTATGHTKNAETLVAQMKNSIQKTGREVAGLPRPSVLLLWSVNPIYTTSPGMFLDNVVRLAGGRNAVTVNLPGSTLSPEAAIALRPQIIIADPATQTQAEHLPGWATGVPAVEHRAFYFDPALEVPGPRLADAIQRLAAYLHPKHVKNQPAH